MALSDRSVPASAAAATAAAASAAYAPPVPPLMPSATMSQHPDAFWPVAHRSCHGVPRVFSQAAGCSGEGRRALRPQGPGRLVVPARTSARRVRARQEQGRCQPRAWVRCVAVGPRVEVVSHGGLQVLESGGRRRRGAARGRALGDEREHRAAGPEPDRALDGEEGLGVTGTYERSDDPGAVRRAGVGDEHPCAVRDTWACSRDTSGSSMRTVHVDTSDGRAGRARTVVVAACVDQPRHLIDRRGLLGGGGRGCPLGRARRGSEGQREGVGVLQRRVGVQGARLGGRDPSGVERGVGFEVDTDAGVWQAPALAGRSGAEDAGEVEGSRAYTGTVATRRS